MVLAFAHARLLLEQHGDLRPGGEFEDGEDPPRLNRGSSGTTS